MSSFARFSSAGWIALAAVSFALLLQGHTLWRPWEFTDDIAMHHVWLDGGAGSGFAVDDPWLQTAKDIQPYVVAWLWQLIRLVLPTVLVGKCLALVLLALTGFLIFQVAAALKSVRAGWLAMGLMFVSDAWIGMSGGFARSFAWPLVCGFLAAMMTRRLGWTALCLFLSAALYPVVFVLLLAAYALLWLAEQMQDPASWPQAWNLRRQWKLQWPVVLAVLAGGVLVVLKSRELSLHPLLGPQVSLATIQGDPVYGMEGRVPLWPQPSLIPSVQWSLMPWDKALLEPVHRHAGALPAVWHHGVMTVLAGISFLVPGLALFLVFRRRPRCSWVVVALVLAGIFTFLLAALLLPRLYESGRYLVWSLPVVVVLSWALLMDEAVDLLRTARLRAAACVCIAIIIAIRLPAIRGKGAEDVSEYAALYRELDQTASGEMIACFPRTADFIPLLGHRTVFISHESSHAILFSRYKDMVMERHGALLKALYAAGPEDARAFCAERGVHWLVVEEKYYRRDMQRGFHFAPFEDQVRHMLKQTPEPWLLAYAKKSGTQVQPGVYLLNTRPLIQASAKP